MSCLSATGCGGMLAAFPALREDADRVGATPAAPPFVASPVEAKAPGGQEDGDGDGIVDARDVCPDTPADVGVDSQGCPVPVRLRFAVAFSSQGDRLDPGQEARLEELAAFLRQHPHATARLEGHADNKGSAERNFALSRRRAEQVHRVLVERHGISPARLYMEAHGDAKPIAPNLSEAGRARNRRVEVSVEGVHARPVQWLAQQAARRPDPALAANLPMTANPFVAATPRPGAAVPVAPVAAAAVDPVAAWRERTVPHAVVDSSTPIQFASMDMSLSPEEQRKLESMGVLLAQRQDLRVVIQGHADANGDRATDRAISAQRAELVRRYLEERCRVEPTRLETKAYGAEVPLADNAMEEGRQRNRRVVLRILPLHERAPEAVKIY